MEAGDTQESYVAGVEQNAQVVDFGFDQGNVDDDDNENHNVDGDDAFGDFGNFTGFTPAASGQDKTKSGQDEEQERSSAVAPASGTPWCLCVYSFRL